MEDTAANSTSQSDLVAAEIRHQIVSGEFGPGKRLPTFQQIGKQFEVGRTVVQLAVNRLKRDGFVKPDSAQGLYVEDTPPHLRRYGLAFAMPHGDPSWSRFDEALVKEAQKRKRDCPEQEFEVFADLDSRRDPSGALAMLKREVSHDRLAGLILTPGTHDLIETEPFHNPRMPKVLAFGAWDKNDVPAITDDGKGMVARGLRWLAGQGRSRVAVLRLSDYGNHWNWESFYADAGLEYRWRWNQAVCREDPGVLRVLVPLLLDYPEPERPDGLLIVDDNLVDHAISAVVHLGLQVGSDLDIVAHCNWPCPQPSLLPVRRIGFDARLFLDLCLDAINCQRRGEPPIPMRILPAMFEDEVALPNEVRT